MYTVLIAEDELLVRIGMASCVPWEKLGMRVVAETSDGESAWAAYQEHRPDIVITDLRMPRMDGLELLKRIRGENRNCAVIIVTNVEQGEMLEEAKRLGITDVMLKAVMTREDIYRSVVKARSSLPYKPSEMPAEVNLDKLWRRYLLDRDLRYEEFCDQCARKGCPPFAVRGLILFHIFPDEKVSQRMKESMNNLVLHRLPRQDALKCIEIPDGALILLKETVVTAETKRSLAEIARYISINFGVQVGMILQSACVSQDALSEYVQTALNCISEQAYFDAPVLGFDESGLPDVGPVCDLTRQLYRFEPLLRNAARAPAIRFDGMEMDEFADRAAALPRLFERGWEAVREEGRKLLRVLGVFDDFSGLNALLGLLEDALNLCLARITGGIRPEILNVMLDIEAHLSEDLSVRYMSEKYHYHPAYFSNLFKRETGWSYTDYIGDVRMRQAQKLLKSSDMTLQQISDACGFSDLSYFCFRFKRAVGVSPGQWRDKQ